MITCGKVPFTKPTCSLRGCWRRCLYLLVCAFGLVCGLEGCGSPEGRVVSITADCVWRSGLPARLGLLGAQEGPITVLGASAGAAGTLRLPTVTLSAANSNQQQVQEDLESGAHIMSLLEPTSTFKCA
jgi:hypothetical protein